MGVTGEEFVLEIKIKFILKHWSGFLYDSKQDQLDHKLCSRCCVVTAMTVMSAMIRWVRQYVLCMLDPVHYVGGNGQQLRDDFGQDPQSS